jgi:two-component system NtrC family sensor kinase
MKENHYANMRKIVLASMIVIPLVSFVLILGIGYYYFTTSLETSTIASMKRIVDDHRHMIESFLRERKSDLEFILQSYTYEFLSHPLNLLEVFERLQRESNTFLDLGVFNEEGLHVAYQGPYKLTGKDYGKEDWFREVVRKGYYISDVFLGYRRIPHFIIALAREEKGKKWVIRATIDTYLFNTMVKSVRMGKTGEAYILSQDGVFQTEKRSGGNLMAKDPDNLKYSAPQDAIKTFIQKDSRGEAYLYATAWLGDKKWLLVVRQEKADAFRALRSASYAILLIVVIGGSAIIAVAFYLTERIVRRMEQADVEKNQLGEQLIRASRLAELGEMAAGFAHEINNPLQIMKSEHALVEMILGELKDKHKLDGSEDLGELKDSLDQISVQIERCAQITQAILKFGRQDKPQPREIDLRILIPEIIGMVEKKASIHGITLMKDYSEGTPLMIHGDPGQLQQVLLNILNNAIDAIVAKHGSDGGHLSVQTRLEETGKVAVVVNDNGCGISPDNLKKVFSPFFTTKPVGKGTGLGLSVCHGIIGNMGGAIEVSSQMGVGTTFVIRLPAGA